jgi:hypothetical protein
MWNRYSACAALGATDRGLDPGRVDDAEQPERHGPNGHNGARRRPQDCCLVVASLRAADH